MRANMIRENDKVGGRLFRYCEENPSMGDDMTAIITLIRGITPI